MKLLRPDVTLVALSAEGLDSKFGREARHWITSMKNEVHGEDGPDFWNWMVENQRLRAERGTKACDNWFLRDKATGLLVATGSIVHDDRGVGAAMEIPGLWLGGLNVRNEFRGRNLGHLLVELRHEAVQQLVNQDGKPLQLNIFTSNPWTAALYKERGFQDGGEVFVKRFGKVKQHFSKVFQPAKA